MQNSIAVRGMEPRHDSGFRMEPKPEEAGSIANETLEAINGRLKEEVEERERAESFLNRAIDQSPYAIWISDEEGTLQHANPALKDFLNLTDEQLVGRYNVLKDPVVERQGLMPLIRGVHEDGKTIQFTCE